jgi:DNA invertase Pin-like site-specific DNA recombinase
VPVGTQRNEQTATMTVTGFDLTKLAVVYLRQSTPGQVRDHVVATAEQYRLREIPERLGFPADRILMIDDDLGVSGQTIAGRKGMLRVLELLEQGATACVVVRDISRLSRDEFNTDIGLIAKECYRSGARIITPEKTYNPADPADQLFLGFQGLIAGWDRANIVRRLEHHRRAKQARGCPINGAVPAGYEKIEAPRQSPAHGKLRITQDGEVRERIALILQKGLELGGVLAVVRFLHEHALAIPVMRGEDGAKGRRVIHWVAANRDRVTRILKNPAYAGAVVNGRRVQVLDRATGRRRWSTRRSYEQCMVIRDAHAVYISWDEHLELLAAIARNNQAKTYSTGEALLSGLGLARCGVCGEPMVVQYNNPTRERPGGRSGRNTPFYYVCTRRQEDGAPSACQNPAGPHIDRAVTQLVLFALGQLDLEGVRETLRDRELRAAETLRLRQQRIEALARRAQMLEDAIADATRSEARARLVARFEAALCDLNAAKAEAVHPVVDERPRFTEATLERLAVFREPATAWSSFTLRTRKEIIRALADRVTIHPDLDGYFVVPDWYGGGRAAAKVKTLRRRKIYPVPEEILALFDGEIGGGEDVRSIAGCSGTGLPGGRGSPRPDAAVFPRR